MRKCFLCRAVIHRETRPLLPGDTWVDQRGAALCYDDFGDRYITHWPMVEAREVYNETLAG